MPQLVTSIHPATYSWIMAIIHVPAVTQRSTLNDLLAGHLCAQHIMMANYAVTYLQ